ncbi:MAG: phosphoenolpyruvate--protein phosphotransferase [Lachnospiraceae bacterium]|nr:phosphoenolpyruvate--protein phosphotransferase [Lachnospiraceae bacterium]
MEIYQGKSIFGGIAIGKIYCYSKEERRVRRSTISNVEQEIKRFEEAKGIAVKQLEILYQKAVKEVGEKNAEIFEAQSLMIEDEDYKKSVYNIIENQKLNAEYAVAITGDNFAEMFAGMEDEYFKARSIDVKDISERIINVLLGKETKTEITEPSIIVAKDLAPSETVQMEKKNILAFVTEEGSVNSHTAILARMMNIPAVIGIALKKEWNGKQAVVDGHKGTLIIEPDEVTLQKAREEKERDEADKTLLLELKGKEDITKDGRKINLFANIGNPSDVVSVHENDAKGIGLFRSEFLYLEKTDFPTEEEQFHAYKMVAENMAGRKVIIRTMDIGADKQADYFQLPKEDNPAMGYRAIRICLDADGGNKGKVIFKTQLRAIYRASTYGNLAIMFPMIISLDEVKQIKKIVSEVKNELKEDGIPYAEIQLGIMIETPAAVMISDELAKEVDFFSIGTNDLTQYTLAIDRQNTRLDSIYDSHHKAILKMIQMVVENGHKENCWVGICGELAADTTLTKTFVDMGIDELSVAPSMVLKVRKAIRSI